MAGLLSEKRHLRQDRRATAHAKPADSGPFNWPGPPLGFRASDFGFSPPSRPLSDQLSLHHLRAPRLLEPEAAGGAVGVDDDRVAFAELAPEDSVGERVLDPLLDHPLERAG